MPSRVVAISMIGISACTVQAVRTMTAQTIDGLTEGAKAVPFSNFSCVPTTPLCVASAFPAHSYADPVHLAL